MRSLHELNKIDDLFLTDKGSIHNYLQVYDNLFAPIRRNTVNIFEVGYQYGGSAVLWQRYFMYANIRSIDIKRWEPTGDRDDLRLYNKFIEPQGRIRLDFIDINNLPKEYFKDFTPDIAIDDGSHLLHDQITFINLVYPFLNPGGIMIVEDISNIDLQRSDFEKTGYEFEVIDLRKDTGLFDDVLLIFRK